MRKGKFQVVASFVAALVVAVFFTGTQVAKAAPGDGASIGVFGGFGMAVTGVSVTDLDTSLGNGAGEHKFTDGGLGADGAEYGVKLGYGLRLGVLHAGIEGEAAWSDIKVKATTVAGFNPNQGTTGDGTTADVTSAEAEMERSYAATARLGFYPTPHSLLYFTGGGVASKFNVAYGTDTKEYWAPGIRLGAGVETTLMDGLSVRVEAMHNNYYNANVRRIGRIAEGGSPDSGDGVRVKLYPSSFVARVGVNFNFGGLF
jgi:opacity protein-like surface antigen